MMPGKKKPLRLLFFPPPSILLLLLSLFLGRSTPWVLLPLAASHAIKANPTTNRGTPTPFLPMRGGGSGSGSGSLVVPSKVVGGGGGHEAKPTPPGSLAPDRKKESIGSLLFWLFAYPQRTLLPGIRVPILLNALTSAAIAYGSHKGVLKVVDATAHGYVAGPLGFLLAFRCSEGLRRCDTAKEVWDDVLNLCRDIVRAIISLDGILEPKQSRRLVDLTCAFALALEAKVMQKDRNQQLMYLLNSHEVAKLDSTNSPLAVTELLSLSLIECARVNSNLSSSPQFPRLLGFVDELGHSVTVCERLMKPAVPQIYTAHTLRMLALWTYTLPLTLLNKIRLQALPLHMAIITWALYGLFELGVMIQYPFHAGVVNLQSLWEEILLDTRECFEGARVANSIS